MSSFSVIFKVFEFLDSKNKKSFEILIVFKKVGETGGPLLSLQPLGTRTFHPNRFQLSIAIRIEVIRILLLAIPLSTNLLRLHFAAAFISAFITNRDTFSHFYQFF